MGTKWVHFSPHFFCLSTMGLVKDWKRRSGSRSDDFGRRDLNGAMRDEGVFSDPFGIIRLNIFV